MSELDDIARAVSRLKSDQKNQDDQKKLSALEVLVTELGSAASDIVDILESRSQDDVDRIVDAIRQIKLQQDPHIVNVEPVINIDPTPVTVQNNIDVGPTPVRVINQIPQSTPPVVNINSGQQIGSTWEVRIPGLYNGPDRVMTITRTS